MYIVTHVMSNQLKQLGQSSTKYHFNYMIQFSFSSHKNFKIARDNIVIVLLLKGV